MVIVTVALVSMAELMAITLRMQMMGRNQTAAIRMVQSKIDQLIAVNFSDPTVAVGGSLTSDVATYNDDPEDGYHRRWQISSILKPDGTTEAKIRTLTVKVIPTRTDHRTTTDVQLTTIIRDP